MLSVRSCCSRICRWIRDTDQLLVSSRTTSVDSIFAVRCSANIISCTSVQSHAGFLLFSAAWPDISLVSLPHSARAMRRLPVGAYLHASLSDFDMPRVSRFLRG